MTYTIAKTPFGDIRGTVEKGCGVWRGIPYARARRFSHAQTINKEFGTMDALRYGPICAQHGMRGHDMAEDCLTLNIWSTPGQYEKPVLVYIHGGSFASGMGSDSVYEGRRLASGSGVVVITINYRLGALGFMDFSELSREFQPNCGLSDMVAALRWVKENISAFGGDPNNVTVIGQSAGATAVSTLAVMPEAKPYISKAIIMSGGPIWLHAPNEAHSLAKQFMRFMGITGAAELLNLDARTLTAKQRKFMNSTHDGEGTFSIVADGSFVPKYPIPAAASGATEGIPLLIGTTRDELSFACNRLLSKVMALADVDSIAAREKKEIRLGIKEAYERYGSRARCMYVTDYIFRMASLWYAQAANAFSNTWMYSFNYEPLAMRISTLHACHFSDIPFLFGNFGKGRVAMMFVLSPIRTVIKRISADMQQDFTSFAKTGSLNWRRCEGKDTPAKCYDKHVIIAPMVEPEIAEKYEGSRFKRDCLNGVNIAATSHI